MSEIKIINTPFAPAVFGPFSQGVKTDSLVFTTGQLPIDPKSGKIVSDDVQEQTRQVFPGYPRPIKGILVAMMFINCMLASKGRLAMSTMARAT